LQLYGQSLLEFSRESTKSVDAVRVVCESVAEIRSGLMSDCSVVQSCHWDLKLTAVCTWRTLMSHALHARNDIPHSVPNCDLIHSLPHWNFAFYFWIVMQNKWTKYFVEVIAMLFADVVLVSTCLKTESVVLSLLNTAAFDFCFTGQFFRNHQRLRWIPKSELLGIFTAGLFTGWMDVSIAQPSMS